jgi:hypothetical protein
VEFVIGNSHENLSSSPLCFQHDQKHNIFSLNTIMYLSHKISCMFLLKYCHLQADYKNRKGNIYVKVKTQQVDRNSVVN